MIARNEHFAGNLRIGTGCVITPLFAFFLVTEIRNIHRDAAAKDAAIGKHSRQEHIECFENIDGFAMIATK